MKVLWVIVAIFAGFCGGFLSSQAGTWFAQLDVQKVDAVAVANTYIVFTTIIFVGVTVLLGVAGYIFTQQFSAAQSALEHQVFEDLRKKLASDVSVAIKLSDALLDNPDVKVHLEAKIQQKAAEVLDTMASDRAAAADSMASQADSLRQLSENISGKSNGRSAG